MYKSKLQELCQQQSWNLPEYLPSKIGPDHNPRFTATITVNGVVFKTPDQCQCRSSKEAQNRVAEMAFHHFTAPKPLQDSPNKPLCNPSIPSSSGSANSLEVKIEGPLEVKNGKKSTGFANSLEVKIEGPLEVKNGKKSTVVQHLYKNQLQNYAQKKNLALPMYSWESEGPPHASRFKSKVTFDGHTYGSLEYFSTIREAEHAAAKVACDSLLLNEVQEDESGLYKNMLQELAQRKGFHLPNYNTTVSGPPHTPIFISTVELCGQLFQGQEAKNKKQAEMNAAKVAYISLQEFRETQGSTFPSPDYDTKEVFKASSSMLPLVTNTGDLLQNVKPEDNLVFSKKKDKEDKGRTIQDPKFLLHGCDIEEAMKFSSSILQSNISSGDMPKNAKPKSDLKICGQKDEEDEDGNQELLSCKSTTGDAEVNTHRSSILPLEVEITGKRHRCSSSADTVYETLRDPFPSISSSSEASTSSPSSNSECSTKAITSSTIIPPAGTGNLPSSKVLIYPRKRLNMTIPDGATELPFSNDEWVALKMDM